MLIAFWHHNSFANDETQVFTTSYALGFAFSMHA
jgi:hypothetical protein